MWVQESGEKQVQVPGSRVTHAQRCVEVPALTQPQFCLCIPFTDFTWGWEQLSASSRVKSSEFGHLLGAKWNPQYLLLTPPKLFISS